MTDDQEILAWEQSANADGNIYNSERLKDIAEVEILFDLCNKERAVILAAGWEFLFDEYGLQGLISIDKQSKWFIDDVLTKWISAIVLTALNSGYNPISGEFGDYEEASGLFLPLEGETYRIDWDSIAQLSDKVKI